MPADAVNREVFARAALWERLAREVWLLEASHAFRQRPQTFTEDAHMSFPSDRGVFRASLVVREARPRGMSPPEYKIRTLFLLTHWEGPQEHGVPLLERLETHRETVSAAAWLSSVIEAIERTNIEEP